MMTKITYALGGKTGTLYWAAAEQFDELENTTFNLGEMEAVAIEKLSGYSVTAKILLSAVAGAVIQHLLDQGLAAQDIFTNGTFTIEKSVQND